MELHECSWVKGNYVWMKCIIARLFITPVASISTISFPRSPLRHSRDENRFKTFSNFHKFLYKRKIENVITKIFSFNLITSRKVVPVDLHRHFSLFAAGEFN